MSTIYTAKVVVTGGREGSIRSEDGLLETRLAFPTKLGGSGEGTNPEQLFAAGYGACFATTLATLAKADGVTLTNVEATSEVDMMLHEGTYDLGVRLAIKASGTDPATMERLIERAKQACPYSRATRNNIQVSVQLLR